MSEVAKAAVGAKSTLYLKLAEVMAEIDRVPKNGFNKFHNYAYATDTDIAEAARSAMATRKLVMVPNVLRSEWAEVTTNANKRERLCTLTMRFDVHDGESGEVMSFEMLGQGQDAGDKAVYKAMTGTQKYALLKLFLIPTGDDPEKEEAAKTTPPPPAGVEALKQRVAPSPPPPSAQPEPPAHGELPLSPGPRPQGFVIRFGASKDQLSSDLKDKDLKWYLDARLSSPEERQSIQAEQRWRQGAR